jgi:bifunctional NMN adenylyltransferase/nudix hydrolase
MDHIVDYTLFMGRFQPYHLGHHAVVTKALELSDTVLIGLGSAYAARSLKNPFTVDERQSIIEAALGDDASRVRFIAIEDHRYNLNRWITEVQEGVDDAVLHGKWKADPTSVSLIGHRKDSSSFYLKMFPMFGFIDVANHEMISATDYRHHLFTTSPPDKLNFLVNDAELDVIRRIHASDDFQALIDEYWEVQAYKLKWWPKGPAGAVIRGLYVTVDAAVTCAGHILLVKRGGFPQPGTWALPGGFLNPDETIEDGMIRELREETGLGVPEPVIRGSIASRIVADDIDRDPRGRIISNAFHIDVRNPDFTGNRDEFRLPRVK